MTTTLAGIITDPDTGARRGVRIVVDGRGLRVELSATKGTGQSSADFSDLRAALVAALKEEDER